MQMRLLYLFFAIAVLISYQESKAQNSPFGAGLVNISGAYNYNTMTVGAVANRMTSDQLNQQALSDYSAGISSLNIPLLAKSLTEAQQAVQADDQSHHLAQSAYSGTSTGMNAGNYDFSKFGTAGVSSINDMINSSSAYWPKVSGILQNYGMSLTEDKQYIKTPFGTFPTNASPDQTTQILSQIAGKFGVSSAGIAQGVQQGMAAAQSISKQSFEKAQSAAAEMAINRAIANDKSAPATSPLDKAKGKVVASDPRAEEPQSNVDKNGIDWDAKARAVAKFTDEVNRDLGYDPIWAAKDDLFQKVHEHYQALSRENVFLGQGNRSLAHFFAIGN